MNRLLVGGLIGLALWTTAAAQATGIGSMHQDLDIELDPAARVLRGTADIRLEGSGRTRLALRAELVVEDLALDGEPLGQAPGREAGMQVWWLTLKPSTVHRLVLRYGGPLAGLPEADHRDTLQALPPMAGAAGSYLPGGTGWYPLIGEHPFTYRVDLKLPPGQRGLVPGRLLAEEADAAGYRARYEFSHPAEGIELMAGPYELRERMMARPGEPPIRLRTWFHPELHDLADEYLQAAEGYIRLYSEQIGAYPFSEFSVVSSPLPTGFGMPTLTYLGVDVLRLPFIKSTSLGHEVLHNWWGNGVYVDYEGGNWCEGLTTFMADYYYKAQDSAQAARAMRLDWLRDFAAIAPGQDFPLREFTARSHGTSQIVGYHKAAYVFLMLRDALGPQNFDASLRRFWRDYKFSRASWDDLRHAFEQESGLSLAVFFAQWLDRAGAPKLRITEARARAGTGELGVDVGIEQSPPAYALQVPVHLTGADTHETKLVAMDASREKVSLDTAFRPMKVALDPEFRLFRRLDPRELPPILRQVMLDPGTALVVASSDVAVREAARGLAARLLDAAPQPATGAQPLLVIGLEQDVDRLLTERHLPPRPDTLKGTGSAQVWASRQADGKTLVVISARDADSLSALQRPLPHYGRQSWLVFDGAKAINRGVWPAETPTLRVE
jgi:aminopeptidase N